MLSFLAVDGETMLSRQPWRQYHTPLDARRCQLALVEPSWCAWFGRPQPHLMGKLSR
jgi:hypothetical protein